MPTTDTEILPAVLTGFPLIVDALFRASGETLAAALATVLIMEFSTTAVVVFKRLFPPTANGLPGLVKARSDARTEALRRHLLSSVDPVTALDHLRDVPRSLSLVTEC
ncbi:hypothetical protein [Streptomyces sp. NPDC004270]